MRIDIFIKKALQLLAVVFVYFIIGTPMVVFAAGSGLIPCDGVDCGFSDLIVLAGNFINFLLFKVAAPIAAIVFAIAGYMLMMARGNPAKISEAKAVFRYALWGFVVALSAWLVVEALLTGLGLKGAFWILG